MYSFSLQLNARIYFLFVINFILEGHLLIISVFWLLTIDYYQESLGIFIYIFNNAKVDGNYHCTRIILAK